MPGRRRTRTEGTRRRKAADSFDLVRRLTRRQSAPRKAAAELVRNPLDAGARHVSIERAQQRKSVCPIVRNDGEGVLPDVGRENALTWVATHVGRLRKLGTGPADRTRSATCVESGRTKPLQARGETGEDAPTIPGSPRNHRWIRERETGFEPATSTLARCRTAAEPLPNTRKDPPPT